MLPTTTEWNQMKLDISNVDKARNAPTHICTIEKEDIYALLPTVATEWTLDTLAKKLKQLNDVIKKQQFVHATI